MTASSSDTTIYAIDESRPPVAWSSTWTFLQDQLVSGSEIPEGFTQCTEEEYLEALSYQDSTVDDLDQSVLIDNDASAPIETDPDIDVV
jgi:hypothetical protein